MNLAGLLMLLVLLAGPVPTTVAAEETPAEPTIVLSEEDRKVVEMLELLELLELLNDIEDVAVLEESL